MINLLIYLSAFICLFFIFQVIFFEIARNAAIKSNNYQWFASLDKPYNYTRTGTMIIICTICYAISGNSDLSGTEWFIYLVIFVACGVVADAVTQFLVQKYGQIRCRSQIRIGDSLEKEFDEIVKNDFDEDVSFEISFPQYDEVAIAKKYIQPDHHMSFMSVDEGNFVKKFGMYPASCFDVEPYSESSVVQENLGELPVRVTKLTPENKMPFKDERMDVIMNEYSNYDKNEITRVLKKDGYFICNQYGSHNLKEFLQMYMPIGLKGVWDLASCRTTLETAGYRIEEGFEDYGFLRFHNLAQLRTYFKRAYPDVADNPIKYKAFYLNALKHIREHQYFELSTYRFLVVAKKL